MQPAALEINLSAMQLRHPRTRTADLCPESSLPAPRVLVLVTPSPRAPQAARASLQASVACRAARAPAAVSVTALSYVEPEHVAARHPLPPPFTAASPAIPRPASRRSGRADRFTRSRVSRASWRATRTFISWTSARSRCAAPRSRNHLLVPLPPAPRRPAALLPAEPAPLRPRHPAGGPQRRPPSVRPQALCGPPRTPFPIPPPSGSLPATSSLPSTPLLSAPLASTHPPPPTPTHPFPPLPTPTHPYPDVFNPIMHSLQWGVEPNREFVPVMKDRFKGDKKETSKILIACADGGERSILAYSKLAELGYKARKNWGEGGGRDGCRSGD